MKQTPLTDRHRDLGAKMVDFAGYLMPLQYTSIQEEHRAVREGVGMFDVSHMGEFIVRGEEALDFLQYVTSNDVSRLEIGQAQYSCLPNGKGGIVDDLLVYRLPEEHCSEGERAYMLVVNASNIEKDWNWLQSQLGNRKTTMIDISEKTGLLAVQGPKAAEVLQWLTVVDLSKMKYYTFEKAQFAGVDNVIISATGYTGAGGFELYVDAERLPEVWDAIMSAGADAGIVPVGLGARDTLRLEKGYCLYGNEIDDTTSPLEAGLGWITKLKKGDFVDRDLLLERKAKGLDRKLMGLKLNGRRVPRTGYKIENSNGTEIGVVTSGSQSPTLNQPIGIGYLPTETEVGTEVQIVVGKKKLPAEVIKLPFV